MDSAQWRRCCVSWLSTMENVSLCLLTYDRAVILSVKTPTVMPCRDWRKYMRPKRIARSSLRVIERALLSQPMTRDKPDVEMSTPSLIRVIGPEEQVWAHDLQGDTLKNEVGVVPPQEVQFDLGSPGMYYKLVHKVPPMTQLQLKGAHPKTTPGNEEGTERRDDPEDCAKQRHLAACRTKIR